MRLPVLIATLMTLTLAWAERQPYDRYASIVGRQMFGPLPAGFDPTKMPSEVSKSTSREEKELAQEQEKVKKSIRFSVINVTSEGETVVGFSDYGDPKNPLHYYLKVGERTSPNGWLVKEADPQDATMTIVKDDIEVTLKLGGDSATAPDAVSRVGGGATAATGDAPRLLGSFRERKRQREEEQRAQEERRVAEEKARKVREDEEKARRDAVQTELLNQLQQIKEEQRKARESLQAESEKPSQAADAQE